MDLFKKFTGGAQSQSGDDDEKYASQQGQHSRTSSTSSLHSNEANGSYPNSPANGAQPPPRTGGSGLRRSVPLLSTTASVGSPSPNRPPRLDVGQHSPSVIQTSPYSTAMEQLTLPEQQQQFRQQQQRQQQQQQQSSSQPSSQQSFPQSTASPPQRRVLRERGTGNVLTSPKNSGSLVDPILISPFALEQPAQPVQQWSSPPPANTASRLTFDDPDHASTTIQAGTPVSPALSSSSSSSPAFTASSPTLSSSKPAPPMRKPPPSPSARLASIARQAVGGSDATTGSPARVNSGSGSWPSMAALAGLQSSQQQSPQPSPSPQQQEEKYSSPSTGSSPSPQVQPHPDLGLPPQRGTFVPRVIESTAARVAREAAEQEAQLKAAKAAEAEWRRLQDEAAQAQGMSSPIQQQAQSSPSLRPSSSQSAEEAQAAYAARVAEHHERETGEAVQVAKKHTLAQAIGVAEQVNSFTKKLALAAEKKRQAAAIIQAATDARALARVEMEAERKRKLYGSAGGSSPASSAIKSDSPQNRPLTSPSMTAMVAPPSPLQSSHEDTEIALAVEKKKAQEAANQPTQHPFQLPSTTAPSDEVQVLSRKEAEPLPVIETVYTLSASQLAELTPRKPPQIVYQDREVVKEVVKTVTIAPPPMEPIKNIHAQILSPYASPLLNGDSNTQLKEWHGCTCGCGVAQLSCNMLNQQTQLIVNLQQQYELLQHYVAHLHAGLLSQNIAIDSILPTGAGETRGILVGSLLNLESTNRNIVRDIISGVKQQAYPKDDRQLWAQTAKHPEAPKIANQPLSVQSGEHMTYAHFLKKQFITTSDRNVYHATPKMTQVTSPTDSKGDDDGDDPGAVTSLARALPMRYDNQSIARTIFNSEMLSQTEGRSRMKLDVPEVIVCELGDFETRPRSNAVWYENLKDVPGLFKDYDSYKNIPPPIVIPAPSPSPSPLSRIDRVRQDHRASLSYGALAAGIQRDPSQYKKGGGHHTLASYPSSSPVVSPLRDGTSHLKDVSVLLHHALGSALFKQQCLDEHSGENLALWSEVEAYHAEQDWLKRLPLARHIIQQYIVRDAPEQINLPSQIINDLTNLLKTVEEETHMIDEGLGTAQQIAFKLLSNDSYKRFMSSNNVHGQQWRQYLSDHPELIPMRRETSTSSPPMFGNNDAAATSTPITIHTTPDRSP